MLLYLRDKQKKPELKLVKSKDGINFQPTLRKPVLVKTAGIMENLKKCGEFHSYKTSGYFVLNYTLTSGKKKKLCQATSTNLIKWKKTKKPLEHKKGEIVIADYLFKKQKVKYAAKDGKIYIGFSKKDLKYDISPAPLLEPRKNHFDSGGLEISEVIIGRHGILLVYHTTEKRNHKNIYAFGLAIFDKQDPQKLIWRSEYPAWEQPEDWSKEDAYFIGLVEFKENIILYFGNKHGELISSSLPSSDYLVQLAKGMFSPKIQRFAKNPIIKPIAKNWWESKATFNAAAIYESGRMHLLYRAIGDDDVSVIGYASSGDGYHFDVRLKEPVYVPREKFEGAVPKHRLKKKAKESPFMSGGGGCGGCEDPRVTKIDDTIYMTYVAYDGYSGPRVALTSIKADDFVNHRWNWTKPVLISRPGVVNKNTAILPEKIRGKYVIFHRVYPDILLDYVDDLEFDGKTKWLEAKHSISPRRMYWDSRKAGIGATPLKTDRGWLLIYQGLGEQDPRKYKIGAMLLDLKNPKKILARAKFPILEPDTWYENEGFKFGVVYPCGADIIDGTLFVYYGGADMVMCVATADLGRFLHQLEKGEEIKYEKISLLNK